MAAFKCSNETVSCKAAKFRYTAASGMCKKYIDYFTLGINFARKFCATLWHIVLS